MLHHSKALHNQQYFIVKLINRCMQQALNAHRLERFTMTGCSKCVFILVMISFCFLVGYTDLKYENRQQRSLRSRLPRLSNRLATTWTRAKRRERNNGTHRTYFDGCQQDIDNVFISLLSLNLPKKKKQKWPGVLRRFASIQMLAASQRLSKLN